jgi:excisionase family DNA binding protein
MRMDPSSRVGEELLSADDVAQYLELEPVTIYRWCRDGRLPCLKLGKVWRIRRSALDAFLRQAEQPRTLVAHLGTFLELPDQVLAVSENADLLTRLDAAFLKVGEARSGRLVKLYEPTQTSRRALVMAYRHHGLDAAYLETMGRLQWCPVAAPEDALPALHQVLAKQAGDARPIWVNLNWTHEISLETALRQQAELTELMATHPLAVMTGVVEPTAEMWPPPAQQWQLLGSLRGVIRFSQTGLMLSRVVPPPSG